MDESLTFTISGSSAILDTQFFPPIELSSDKNYTLGLVELLTFNSIPNIDIGCNKFYVGGHELTIPTGSYEIEDIAKYLQTELSRKNINIQLKPNNNTLRSEIQCNQPIHFSKTNSIGPLLGFTSRTLEANKSHESDLPVSILKVNAIRVECNITTGAYINGRKVHTIHEFFPSVPPGYKIIEVPSNVIYLPITTRIIDNIQLRIVDQDGDLVNFRGEVITIRLHLNGHSL